MIGAAFLPSWLVWSALHAIGRWLAWISKAGTTAAAPDYRLRSRMPAASADSAATANGAPGKPCETAA